MPANGGGRITVSILIKALNEGEHIAACVRSALEAVRCLDAEIILADSLSSDDTVARAVAFPITIVQLSDPALRSCGMGAQLAWQYCRGTHVYILDGDMELVPGFLERAIEEMEHDPRLAGVGGTVEEMVIENLVFRSRAAANHGHMRPGPVDRLCQGGLYRRAAVEESGYLSDPNLHSFEELDLGLRLAARGWHLKRLPVPAVRHFGYSTGTWTLLRHRIRSGFTRGPGELLRATFGGPCFAPALREYRLFVATLAWWLALLMALAVLAWTAVPLLALLAAGVLGTAVMMLRKRGMAAGLYAVTAWQVYAAGLVSGFLRRRRDPVAWIPARVVRSSGQQQPGVLP